MNKIYLLLGSNIGEKQQYLEEAVRHIKKNIGKVVRQSKIYSTAAWGGTRQADFLNQVIVAETALTAFQTIDAILEIEKKMGRIRTIKNAPRSIDIDILFYNKEVIKDQKLSVPHPEIPNRRFVLVPLNELAPAFKHPVLQKSIRQLLLNCKDPLNVKKF